jgi:hypothetical protein
VSASRTSSSLNGLMIAITIFIRFHPLLMRVPRVSRPRRGRSIAGKVFNVIQAPCQMAEGCVNLLEINGNGPPAWAASRMLHDQNA